MNRKQAWDKFEKTGKILDYLEYKAVCFEEEQQERRRNAADNRRNRNKRK